MKRNVAFTAVANASKATKNSLRNRRAQTVSKRETERGLEFGLTKSAPNLKIDVIAPEVNGAHQLFLLLDHQVSHG